MRKWSQLVHSEKALPGESLATQGPPRLSARAARRACSMLRKTVRLATCWSPMSPRSTGFVAKRLAR